MERRSFVRGAGLAGVLAAGIAPAVHAQASIRWRMASSFPKSLDTIYGGGEVFAKKVSEMTGGKFQISVHAGGELMPPFGVVDGVQNGTVECCHTVPYYFFGKDETFAIGAAIPFGLNSRQMTAWMQEGNGMKLMREFYKNYNIVNFAAGNTGAQMAGWFRKELKSLADIKGLKMRIGGFAGKVLERLGGVPRDLPVPREGDDRCRRVGRSVRRPEAGLQQGRPVLLLPGVVGRRPADRCLHQPEGIRQPVGRIQGHRGIGCGLRAHRHAGQVRREEPRRAEAAGRQRCQAAPRPEGHPRRGVQGVDGPVQRPVGQEPAVEEGLRGLCHVQA
jgi:hypothetical protein